MKIKFTIHYFDKLIITCNFRWLRNFYIITSLPFFMFLFTSCFFSRKVTKEETVLKDYQVPYEVEEPMEIKPISVFQLTSAETNNFICENEDLSIYYNFHGDDSKTGTLALKIQNKTSQNIFIDLAYSSFIHNGKATAYIYVEDNTSKMILIPDHSYLELNNFKSITNANKDDIETHIIDIYSSKEKFKSFDKTNSPLTIRNKITYGFQENTTNQKVIDNTFWANQINVYSKQKFDSLSKEEVLNKLIYCNSFMGKGMVTKYRTETREVKEEVTRRKTVFAPLHTIFLTTGIATTVLLIVNLIDYSLFLE